MGYGVDSFVQMPLIVEPDNVIMMSLRTDEEKVLTLVEFVVEDILFMGRHKEMQFRHIHRSQNMVADIIAH